MKCWQLLVLWPLFALAALPSAAHADSVVVVLGVRSLDGDDAFARALSGALRNGARNVATWKISDRDISLAQMSLAHGCEEPDARCMADIAATLEVDRLIYGTLVRQGPNIGLALFNFDAVTGQIETSISESVPAGALTGARLGGTAAILAKRLAGISVTGALRVRGDAGARISLDGVDVGAVDARGEQLLAGISVGHHQVRLSLGQAQAREDIEVREAETTTVRLTLAASTNAAGGDGSLDGSADPEAAGPTRDRSPMRQYLGYGALGLAGALALTTTFTWVRIAAIDDDPDLKAYRLQYGRSDDVCVKASQGTLAMREPDKAALESSARNLCDEADTLEILQYVFLGSALAAAGVGTYLLLTKAPADAPLSVILQPSLARGRGQLTATLRF